jgi:hypothetical protein
VFATVKIHQKRYRSCVTHLYTSRTSNKPLILRHSMVLEQFWAECDHHDKFQPRP